MKYLISILLLIVSIQLIAQDFKQALGFRTGITSAVVYKYNTDHEKSFQIMAAFKHGGTQLYYLRQFHHPVLLNHTNQLFLFYGFGGHLGFTTWDNEELIIDGESYRRKQFSVGIGVDMDIGLEYHFLKYPLAFSLDYKPFFEINAPKYLRKNYYDFAVSIIYTF